MAKIAKMTLSKAREYAAKNQDKAHAMYSAAPEFEEDNAPRAKPVARGFASFKEYINKNGRPKKQNPKQSVNLRLDPEVVKVFQSGGPGWQTRINDALAIVVRLGGLI